MDTTIRELTHLPASHLRVHDECRVMPTSRLQSALNLGPISLNGFPLPDEPPRPRAPLHLAYSPHSQLAQLTVTVDPDLLYHEYWYRSGINESMIAHLRMLAQEVSKLLSPGDRITDIGCNDGTFLSAIRGDVVRIGFDPAQNIEPVGVDDFINDYFDPAWYLGASSKVVTALAMFYDIEDPLGFCQDVRSILTDDGWFVLEMHYLPAMLGNLNFDAICHEHLTYWSLSSLKPVLEAAGFLVVDVSFSEVNGGSFRVFAQPKEAKPTIHRAVSRTLAIEEGHLDDLVWRFPKRVEDAQTALLTFLTECRDRDLTVIGYGASTKGNTLLEYFGIDRDLVPFIADRDPRKHGRLAGGSMRIPIISEEEMRQRRPDYLLALPYHFINTFVERELRLIRQGTQFVIPVPTVRFWGLGEEGLRDFLGTGNLA